MDWTRICHVTTLSLSLSGCIVDPSSLGDLETEGSTGRPDPTSSSGDSPTSTPQDGSTGPSEGGSTTAGPVLSCPEFSQCSQPLQCAPEGTEECGHLLARSDADGCPRPYCITSKDCPASYTCNFAGDWGACSNLECYDRPDDGTCECAFGLPCFNDGQCVPDDVYPPPGNNGPNFCGANLDQSSCDAVQDFPAGRCRWYEGFEITAGQLCEERVPTGQCVFISSFSSVVIETSCPSDDQLFPMAREDGDAITVLFVDPQQSPFELETNPQWYPCEPFVAEECTCGCP